MQARRSRRWTRCSTRSRGSCPAGLALFDAGLAPGRRRSGGRRRIKERVHRPVIAFAPGDAGWLKGSARSVPGVHVRDVLDAVATRTPGSARALRRPRDGGGHDAARGSLRGFRRAFAEEVARRIDPDELTGDLHTDGALEAGEFDPATARALREGGPWGAGFPEPMFDGRFGVVEAQHRGGPAPEVAAARARRARSSMRSPSAISMTLRPRRPCAGDRGRSRLPAWRIDEYSRSAPVCNW